ncbi:MAG: ABC transporter ATP-binding protein [Cellulomonadaceae bacterium]
MTTDIITIDGLRRRYGGDGSTFEAVRGVDLTVRQGELFALLGTNGAGKTSLLEVVEGLARPSAGAVRVFGHDPYTERGLVRHRTGIMLQEAGFPADLTVAEMARTWARTLTSPRVPAQVLDSVGLGGRRDVAITSLSGGERRRLDLALAVMGRPDVLFLDEPTTGLDPESRRRAWEQIRTLLAEGTTVVLTTHYLEEAEELADRIAIMHAGRIVVEGTPEQIVADEPARIRFRTHRPAAEIPALFGTLSHAPGRRDEPTAVVVETPRLQEDLRTLLEWAADHGVALHGLDARDASLEQAFLTIAERSPDDADAAAGAGTQEVAA